MVDVIHHDEQQECEVCHKFFDRVFEMELDDIKNYCELCLAHRFGTDQALYFLKNRKIDKHW